MSCSTVRMMLTVSVHCGKQKKKVTNIDSMTTEMKFDERSDLSGIIIKLTSYCENLINNREDNLQEDG